MFVVRTARVFGLAAALCFLSGGFAGTTTAQEKKAADGKKVKSKLKITVPQEDAELQIEGKATKPSGVVREFETPEVESGKKYEYSFSVTWRPNNYTVLTRTKSIDFTGGDDIAVDLTKADPKNPDKAVIRWVPTPDDIVDEMLKLGSVKEATLSTSGPGRRPDVDRRGQEGREEGRRDRTRPEEGAEATDNVKKAKLDKQITIIEGDALKDRDYSEATVVLLYMGNEFNALLRPVLEKQLKPGTRIVSHRFTFGDWAPDKTITVTGQDGDEYKLHLWTVKEKK